MRESLSSRKYTVKSLTEIAERMGITVDRKFRKDDIVNVILAQLETDHAEAIAENRIRAVQPIAQAYLASRNEFWQADSDDRLRDEAIEINSQLDYQAEVTAQLQAAADEFWQADSDERLDKFQDEISRLIDGYYMRMRNRLDHYTRQNGTIRLTPRQARRYNKKTAKQSKRLSA